MTQQEHTAAHESASIQQTPAPDPAPSGTESFAGSPVQGSAVPDSVRDDPNPQPKPEALSHDPLAGAEGDPNRVPSAEGHVSHDTLLDMARVPEDRRPGSTIAPADSTQIKEFGDGVTAAATPPTATGAFGMQLPAGGEVAGGNIAKVLDPPIDPNRVNNPLTKERAALLSPIGQKLAGFIGRPPAEWGLLGPGDELRGHMLLLDLNTGEKVRGNDGHRVNPGQLYANLRNLPESLSTGDTIEQILGAVH